MEKTIVISELIRGELRSRTEAKKIYMRAKDLNSPCVRIDFKDVYFMSRSFISVVNTNWRRFFCLIPFRKELATTSQQASKEIFI